MRVLVPLSAPGSPFCWGAAPLVICVGGGVLCRVATDPYLPLAAGQHRGGVCPAGSPTSDPGSCEASRHPAPEDDAGGASAISKRRPPGLNSRLLGRVHSCYRYPPPPSDWCSARGRTTLLAGQKGHPCLGSLPPGELEPPCRGGLPLACSRVVGRNPASVVRLPSHLPLFASRGPSPHLFGPRSCLGAPAPGHRVSGPFRVPSSCCS